ncbi:ABC transporter permease [Streptomyces europaeiscabiei]|uniref:ABC transporter permease n=1 Tax=Streptomyces europaeiscabiei TaxID=146819 RepID=UPI0029B56897|nr:ABC transporter permease [Streptomyces europaeiscabiei]MDX3692283.1 ABC transporter permease [Streptomyces europaeiscabiei]
MDSLLTEGRWIRGSGEVVAGSAFLRRNGLGVGDHLRVERGHRGANLVVVGEFMESNARVAVAGWPTMRSLAPWEKPIAYHVKLRDGADQHVYAQAAEAADPGLSPSPTGSNSVTQTIIGSATALTLLLAAVASLGVFNTVVLNTRDRRRDLGMLKSIGMTPRQVTVMTVASMALLGALGSLLGIPLGVAGHQLVVPRMADAVDITLPSYMTDVWNAPALAGLALAGLVIAVLGAYLPARRAARLTVADVLHNE